VSLVLLIGFFKIETPPLRTFRCKLIHFSTFLESSLFNINYKKIPWFPYNWPHAFCSHNCQLHRKLIIHQKPQTLATCPKREERDEKYFFSAFLPASAAFFATFQRFAAASLTFTFSFDVYFFLLFFRYGCFFFPWRLFIHLFPFFGWQPVGCTGSISSTSSAKN